MQIKLVTCCAIATRYGQHFITVSIASTLYIFEDYFLLFSRVDTLSFFNFSPEFTFTRPLITLVAFV